MHGKWLIYAWETIHLSGIMVWGNDPFLLENVTLFRGMVGQMVHLSREVVHLSKEMIPLSLGNDTFPWDMAWGNVPFPWEMIGEMYHFPTIFPDHLSR